MDSLRLILLAFAILVFIGIYFWSTRPEKNIRIRPREQALDSPLPETEEAFFDPEVEGVQLRHDARPDQDNPAEDYLQEPMLMNDTDDELLPGTQTSFLFDEDSVTHTDDSDSPHSSVHNDDNRVSAQSGEETILMIGIVPDDDQAFNGTQVLSALREVGMEHGEMDIFHHFGLGQSVEKESLFSLASMFEPGNFDPLQLEQSLSSRGFVLFMRTEDQPDARGRLELMINTAYRLADRLAAQVLDRGRKPLTEDAIEQMRAQLGHA